MSRQDLVEVLEREGERGSGGTSSEGKGRAGGQAGRCSTSALGRKDGDITVAPWTALRSRGAVDIA